MSSRATTFDFGAEFQQKIAALIMRDKTFLPSYRSAVDPQFFSSPNHFQIARCVCSIFDRTGAIPTVESLLEEVRQDKEIVDEQRPLVEAEIAVLGAVDLTDAPYVVEKVVKFGRQQAMTAALIQSAELLQDGDLDEIDKLIAEASMVGTSAVDLGTFYVEEIDDRRESAISDVVVPTMLPTLDRCIRGGLHGGQIGLVAGPMKRGKSMVLQNFAAVSGLLGKTVYYYSFELSEPFIRERVDSRLSGVPMDATAKPENWPAIRAKIEMLASRRGEIVIKEWPAYSSSARQIEEHVKLTHRTKGLWPDLIIVDYLDIMSTWGDTAYEVYHKQGAATAELRALGQKWDIPVWSAVQTGGSSLNAELVDESHMSESKKKGHAADLLVVINQTKDERAAGYMRLFVALNRIGRAQFDIPCRIHYDRAYIHEGPPFEVT